MVKLPGWDFEVLARIMKDPMPTYQYLFTNDKEEFINRMEVVNERYILRPNADNLKYIEVKYKLNQLRNGAELKDLDIL